MVKVLGRESREKQSSEQVVEGDTGKGTEEFRRICKQPHPLSTKEVIVIFL